MVTGTNMFFRSAGSAVGVAVFGAIVNATLGGTAVEGGRVAPAALTTAVHHVFLGDRGAGGRRCWPPCCSCRATGARAPAPGREVSEVAAG